jgi:hypothetical protein
MEFSISVGIVSGAALVFFFFIENFHVYEEPHGEANLESDLITIHSLTDIRFHLPSMPNAYKYLLVFAAGAALGTILIFDTAVRGLKPEKTPTRGARRIHGLRTNWDNEILFAYSLYDYESENKPGDAEIAEVLLIDGDRKNKFVLFNHEEHKVLVGGSCAMCHHTSKSFDQVTPCHECHSDMFLETDIVEKAGKTETAPGYMNAMHTMCLNCHAQVDTEMSRCSVCHPEVNEQMTPVRDARAVIGDKT